MVPEVAGEDEEQHVGALRVAGEDERPAMVLVLDEVGERGDRIVGGDAADDLRLLRERRVSTVTASAWR